MYQVSLTELGNGDVAKFGASVVLPGHHIFMDNYFTTYHILELLKTKGMNAAGTIWVNSFNKPPLFSDPVMQKKRRGYSDKVTSLDAIAMLDLELFSFQASLIKSPNGLGFEYWNFRIKIWKKKVFLLNFSINYRIISKKKLKKK
jgi:hypothetical protein